jgi:hypothetical protein
LISNFETSKIKFSNPQQFTYPTEGKAATSDGSHALSNTYCEKKEKKTKKLNETKKIKFHTQKHTP